MVRQLYSCIHKYIFLPGIFFIICNGSIAQQPAYFILGEEQFKGVQIYDVVQDHDLNYWFATNEGLFYYDYNTYVKIDCKKAKSNAVFNFVINRDGTVYCHNLSNQIFELKNKKCSLFYELKKTESRSDISLAISDNDNLVVGASKIIVINKKGTEVDHYKLIRHFTGPPHVGSDGSVQFHLNACDTIIIYFKNTFIKKKFNILNYRLKGDYVLNFFSNGNSTYAIDLNSKTLFEFDRVSNTLTSINSNPVFNRTQSIRIYETSNEVWAAGTLPGLTLVKKSMRNSKDDVWFDNYFISDVYKDHEGNILLSTFDNGILVIPDLRIPDVINDFHNDLATALHKDEDMGLVIGTSKGVLMNYDNDNSSFNIISNRGNRPIEAIYSEPFCNLIVFDDGKIRAYNKKTRLMQDIILASLKDAVIVSKNLFYIGTNRGILKVKWDGKQNFSTETVNGMGMRVYSMEFEPRSKKLYASTSNGFFSIDSLGKGQKILFQNEEIFPVFLKSHDQKIYIGTANKGVLIAQDGKIVSVIHPQVDGDSISLNKITFYKNTFIGVSANKVFQFDLSGKLLKSIKADFGFSTKRVIDFAFIRNNLWVSHTGGVQKLDLDYLNTNQKPPDLRFNSIAVNDKKQIDFKKSSFNFDQRKFEFVFSSPTIKNRWSIQYHYKLSGYDTKWNLTNFEENKITYNALAPGSYTLKIKGECNGLFTRELFYTFTIASPFYWQWWFIVIALFVFLFIVWFVYRWQLQRQQKKSQQINELNASKLTAIQSQMNPHFIFNSLNSIQDLILKGDVEHSYSYITTFSNLVRKTLNYSDKDFNDFEEEIKLLELYLSLEKLRFKKDLVYTIEKNNVEDIMLPPILIQPFVENALAHGLLHKEGEKTLKIKFELKDVLFCTIEDNGVGREKARAIQKRQKSDHESFSGKAMHRRFEILSNVFSGQYGFIYEDLYDSNGASGTRVTMKIPVKRKF